MRHVLPSQQARIQSVGTPGRRSSRAAAKEDKPIILSIDTPRVTGALEHESFEDASIGES